MMTFRLSDDLSVTLFSDRKVFKETVIARDYQDAREVALARNPGATIVGVTAVFKEWNSKLNSINFNKKIYQNTSKIIHHI